MTTGYFDLSLSGSNNGYRYTADEHWRDLVNFANSERATLKSLISAIQIQDDKREREAEEDIARIKRLYNIKP